MASSPRAEVFHIPTFLLGEMKGLCSRGEWRASRRKTVSRKDCGPSSLRRSIFVFPQLILRNRKRLLRVYDTLKPAVSVLNVRRSKIRDFCRDSPSNPTATVSMPRKFRENQNQISALRSNVCQLPTSSTTPESCTKAVGVAGLMQSQIITVSNFLKYKIYRS